MAVEGLYCKRPIQCLASSEILTPHPLTARRVCTPPPPPLVRGKDTLSGWRGVGVNSSDEARHCSVLYICKYFVAMASKTILLCYRGGGGGGLKTFGTRERGLVILVLKGQDTQPRAFIRSCIEYGYTLGGNPPR
jgi:hypothetical protein